MNKRLVYLSASIVLIMAVYLIYSLLRDLTTPNYNFFGTHYDFIAFYTAASSAWHHSVASVYDSGLMIALQRQIIPHPIGAAGYMPFLNPPFVAVFLSPLALLSVNGAHLLLLGINIAMAVFILYQLTKPFALKQRLLASSLLIMTFPMYQTFVEGQLALFVLFGGCLSYMFLTRRREFLSGMSLVFLWILPQFGIFAAIALAYKRRWTMLKGWAIATVAMLLATIPLTGVKIYLSYVKLLVSVTGNHFTDMNTSAQLTWRGAVNLSMGVNGFFTALFGTHATMVVNLLYALTALALGVFLTRGILKIGRKHSPKQGAYLLIAYLLAVLLVDPHLFAQDLILVYLLLPALYMIYKRARLQVVIIFALVCDIAFLDQYSRVHFFTIIALVAAVYYAKKAFNIKSSGSKAARGAEV